ncbi:hypothetical protein DRO42_01260 [Candidatus Bathyarchaeota archaeon]|nr:MAG: hypothetical protein DRO42_01260 [Candidatus Bathyarchaeota archaeon]
MGVERVLSIGERLHKLLEEAEREAERKIAEAQKKANEMIAKAKAEAEDRQIRARRGAGIDDLIRAEEEKAKKEAAKIMEDYRRKAEELRKVPDDRFKESVDLVLREVLPK